MTPAQFQRIRNLFEAALERRFEDRAAFVVEACGEDQELRRQVGRLLEAHDATMTLAQKPPTREGLLRTDPTSREGRRLGPYEILRELGHGGMGRVYLAKRADEAFQKSVAIKILRTDAASAEVIERFRREREILAQLEHPNIARLLDAGETEDGLPYFVMEFAEGRPITEHADAERLSVEDRLTLFRQVCDAVEYAHQRNVVHRDLKPGNVLVTAEGQVKLLDFGIAHLVAKDPGVTALTRSGMWLMTPEYASPEQVRGEATVRTSDVYALGVLLFELLTGHRPYRLHSRIVHEIVRAISEDPPTRPSAVIAQPVETTTADGKFTTLSPETTARLRQTSVENLHRQLAGDLDNVILKALEKQPQDRYASALQLRSDIDRHLAGEPVWARGSANWRQLGLRMSRHRVALVLIAAFAAAALTGSITLQWSTLAWAAGAAALIGLWHAATDREVGRRLANSWLFSPAMLALVAAAVVIRTDYRAIGIPAAGIALLQLGGWFTRGRWGGSLIIDLRTKVVTTVLPVGYTILAALVYTLSDDPNRGWYTCLIAAAAAFCYTEGAEVRQNGFVRHGRLISWSRIASWTWKGNVLVLNLHRRIQFLPPVRLKAPEEHRDRIDAILKRQLGDWPGGASGNLNHQ